MIQDKSINNKQIQDSVLIATEDDNKLPSPNAAVSNFYVKNKKKTKCLKYFKENISATGSLIRQGSNNILNGNEKHFEHLILEKDNKRNIKSKKRKSFIESSGENKHNMILRRVVKFKS